VPVSGTRSSRRASVRGPRASPSGPFAAGRSLRVGRLQDERLEDPGPARRVPVRDPLSRFFAMRRSAFEPVVPAPHPRGWKLLLDILATAPDLTVAELPTTFRPRCRGKTKMSLR